MALVYTYFPSLTGYSVISSFADGISPTPCEGTNPIIPEYYDGVSGYLPVVRIGINAFSKCNDIQTITLSNNIKIISNNAFGSSSLKTIDIPDSVNSIGVTAFGGCSQLTSIKLSNNLQNIPSNLFVQCTALGAINIPDSVTGINNSAFAQCSNLKTVVLGKNVKNLGAFCFAQCSSLENLFFKGGPPVTGSSVFSLLNPNQVKIKIKKYFVTGWSNTFGDMPVVLWSDNTIKSGGTGKLVAKKVDPVNLKIEIFSNAIVQNILQYQGVGSLQNTLIYFEDYMNQNQKDIYSSIKNITKVNFYIKLESVNPGVSNMRLGSIYADLIHSAAFEGSRTSVLINRPGRAPGNTFGSPLNKLNVKLTDSANENIFNISPFNLADFQGDYQPDGRSTISPHSSPVPYNTNDIDSNLSKLNGSVLRNELANSPIKGSWKFAIISAQVGSQARLTYCALELFGVK